MPGAFPQTLRTLGGLIQLVRPLNAVIAYGGVLVGGLLAGGADVLTWSGLHLAALSVVLIAAGANADNDRLDLETDRHNRPDRPLPSGAVSTAVARWVWLSATGAALVLAALVSAVHLAIAAGSATLLAVYSRRLKSLPLLGNGVVAGVLALALVYGGLATGRGTGALVGAVFAFLTNLAREVVKDVEDLEGDRVAGRQTLAVAWGADAAMRLAMGVVVVTLAVLPLPYLALNFGGLFLLVGMGAAVALAVAFAQGRASSAGSASAALKTAMVLGIVALALGRVTP
ncbi:MAG TPA: geranylgeranylglycerol-phosphate geranylgeranyltransferase [Rhodothermales bacterium]|nr:geranylgeranylglycerol-phosphate geranylgeranyltransferase [Rhodothermales bacterium]